MNPSSKVCISSFSSPVNSGSQIQNKYSIYFLYAVCLQYFVYAVIRSLLKVYHDTINAAVPNHGNPPRKKNIQEEVEPQTGKFKLLK